MPLKLLQGYIKTFRVTKVVIKDSNIPGKRILFQIKTIIG